jgi:hypothetical protein
MNSCSPPLSALRYFESILAIAEEEWVDSDIGMEAQTAAYIATVDYKRQIEEEKRAEEEAAAAAAATAAAAEEATTTTTTLTYDAYSERVEVTFTLPFPIVDLSVEVLETAAEGQQHD